jgi:hypothetical protein
MSAASERLALIGRPSRTLAPGKYRAYLDAHGRKPIFYDRRRWTPIPASFSPPSA